MFERIVLATDLSPDWDQILVCAGEFKSLGCEQIVLPHVVSAKEATGAHPAAHSEVLLALGEHER
jgi:hypothetical protein